jgi:hypothetical protein
VPHRPWTDTDSNNEGETGSAGSAAELLRAGSAAELFGVERGRSSVGTGREVLSVLGIGQDAAIVKGFRSGRTSACILSGRIGPAAYWNPLLGTGTL